MRRFVLASQSPRRAEILSQIGVQFEQISNDVAEQARPQEKPLDYVLRLAEDKARSGWLRLGEPSDVVVLGADTIVVLDDEILEKPHDAAHGTAMLTKLGGRIHQVFSAIALVNKDEVLVDYSCTQVEMGAITQEQASRYWQTGEPQDKAGGYGIQGLGSVFIKKISGSYSGVVGLPIETLVPMLEKMSVAIWQE